METENPTLPGNPELPSSQEELQSLAALDTGTYRYSVEDYFRKPALSAFKLSPGGTWIAYRERDEHGRRPIFVRHFETGEVRKVLDEGDELIDGYLWVTDDRLLYVQDKSGDENHQLYGINVDGTGFQALTPFDGVKVMLLNQLKEDPEHIIIQMNKENPQLFEPYKINVNTGALEKLYTNDNPMSPVMGYQFDKDGRLRALTRQENGVEYVLLYRKDEDAPFEEVVRTGWQDSFGLLGFDYTSDNPHLAYVSSNLESDTEELIRYDLATRTKTETLFRHETYDAGGLTTSRKRGFEIDFYYYTGEKDIIIPVSETFTRLHSIFTAYFQGMEFSVAGRTDDESRYLLYAGSDRNYGAYYLYDTASDSFEKIAEMMPHLNPADMAEMRPVQFKSRDGLTLHGYLTLPAEASEGKVPLIVNPHGGPYGPRDEWGFNPEAQLFASRGYATLQINYRGSGGYGKKFYLAGSKQIGRRMLDDLEDGVAFALENFSIDPQRVAIYGGSYGGLAALGSLVKTPELYCCAVDYVGVSNLFTFYESFPPYWKPFMGQLRAQWYDFEDETDQEIMKQVSPALNTEKITRPVYVVQGANDPRVNINESDQMVANLRARSFHVPYMVKYNEGHGFQHEENRIELYKTMLGFFARHLRN
ncbi:Dipeptidyl aminopeptidase/acylaminoacyl peptidase [Cyclonatronum proteinivorum]|uniref:Dipeptidyl aminopeptidase/acylaminoacyl peptidase n=1 Tax=Cyclonatronum proteinivorum TaxID=1457365 RepID=A0A345UGR1_9BACT|nr:S9 family peptidase [Cyclonatronum proteinivorum]AXI99662.1 Dipeptidyl aminopeptidase/acylaminoacyl peptidase [Cyclonatronum proteinivorum]